MAASYWKNVLRMISSSSSFRKCAVAGLTCGGYLYSKSKLDDNWKPPQLLTFVHANSSTVHNLSLLQDNEKKMQSAVGARGRRFVDFATVVVNNELYMTPKDFLESVIQERPKLEEDEEDARFGHQQLSIEQALELVAQTPPRADNSLDFFRNLNSSGLISYTEYLFLLCVITKPKAGFEIAFKMFDTDENQIVDKDEFLVLGEIFEKRTAGGDGKNNEAAAANNKVKTEKEATVPTTLNVHFFGEDGTQVFNYADFFKFMDNLQSEILEMEFLVYSQGMNFISEEDFARVLLRFTDSKDTEESIVRLRNKMSVVSKGISYPEFRNFFQFINNLEDFAIALRLYTLSGRAIGKSDFKRAVKVSTGQDLSDNVVSTIFLIFDADGDEKLSHVEFLGVMKDRVQRGFRRQKLGTVEYVGLDGFHSCLTKELNLFMRNLAARTQANQVVK